MHKKIVLILFVLIIISIGYSQNISEKCIILKLESITDTDNSYDNKPRFNINYTVENYGYGTLYAMMFEVKVYDDRDNEMDVVFDQMNPFEYVLSFTSNSKYPVLRVGEKMSKVLTITGNKKYIRKVVITGFDNHNFSMRMLPEEVDPLNLIKTFSNIPNVSFIIDTSIKR